VSGAKKTVLVVDDDPEIRKLLVASLARLGFQVSSVGDGRAAMKALETQRPTLLCLDLMLPESSGYDVCEFVQKTPALAGLPILMISARTMPGDRAHAEELGVKAFLPKPFTQAELQEHVRHALEGTDA
jgi:two-component system chemotaxis response regulator CheY